MTTSTGDHFTFTQEHNFTDVMMKQIAPFWAKRQEGFHTTRDKVNVFWCHITDKANTKAIFVVNGRIESSYKYQELFFDLFQQGYNIYSFDHRGQGLSDRMAPNPEMGHVESFDDYLQDMDEIIELFNLAQYEQCHLLAHSMGGNIATRYIQTRAHHPFSKIALSAPMYGVNLAWYLKPIAALVAQAMTYGNSKPTYAPGYKGYNPKPFADNPLSQSEVRYRWFRELYEQKPKMKLGGPSTRWVWQGLVSSRKCLQHSEQITIPLLLVQAGADTIVSNQAQDEFISKLKASNSSCQLLSVSEAKHEILFEADQYRNPALEAISQFFIS
ncbi:alpha/beta fold hydrolase [Vibrio hippocampi]|nr:alpha/beta fold hydrolase [Vibrio hippocampi]